MIMDMNLNVFNEFFFDATYNEMPRNPSYNVSYIKSMTRPLENVD